MSPCYTGDKWLTEVIHFVNLEGKRHLSWEQWASLFWFMAVKSRENSALNPHLSLLQESPEHFKMQQGPCGGRDETCMGPS